MVLRDLETQLQAGKDLAPTDIQAATDGLLDENGDVSAKTNFLKALAVKGEAPGEIAGFVDCFLQRAVDPGLKTDRLNGPMLDVCGTGGDKLNLFNVSTTSMFVLAAAGICVVKHGNRGITSKSGGADVLEALGIRIDLPPKDFCRCVEANGIGFLFAPMYHPAFKAVVPVRAQLAKEGVRTIFNLLGPLLNPVRPDHQLIGVFGPELPPVFAEILAKLGRKSAWAVHGTTEDGRSMDEISTLGSTSIVKVENGVVTSSATIQPADLGISVPNLEELAGGEAAENAEILRNILNGKDRGPKRDLVLLNSAAGLVITGKAPNLTTGLKLAGELIDNGSALGKLEALIAFSAAAA